MDVKSEFKVRKEDGRVVVEQLVTKVFSVDECWSQLKQLSGELLQVEQSINKTMIDIEGKALEASLERQTAAKLPLEQLKKDWEAVLESELVKRKVVLEEDLRVLMRKRKFSKLRGDSRIVVANQILSEVITKHGLDRGDSLVLELRKMMG